MPFAPIQKLKVAEQVASSIRDAIVEGRLTPGDTLPSERSLADQFEVNRSSVREALTRLEAWGLVEVRHGGGTRVRDFLASAGLTLLPWLVAPGGSLDPEMLADLLEVRVMLLRWTARQAARRAEPARIEALGHTLRELEQATDPQTIQRLDWDFYEQMVAMTGNRVLAMVSGAVRRVYLENQDLFDSLYPAEGFDAARHRAAFEGVREGDPDRAGEAMGAYAESALGGLR